MSVSFYKLISEPFYLGGRNEANILDTHFGGNNSRVMVNEDSFEEDIQSAKDCDGKCMNFEGTKAEHDEIVAEMEKTLRQALVDEKTRRKAAGDQHWDTNTWVELDISW